MKQILILGAGKFGKRAVRLLDGNEKHRLAIVDADPRRCEALAARGLKVICADGITYLADSLASPDPPDWIIPAIPQHVAFEWLGVALPEGYTIDPMVVPEQVRVRLPNPLEGEAGQVYTSYADFICPDDCPEPADICTFTGEPRKGILYQTLAQIDFEVFTSVVVRSRQLAPGLGGYRPSDLFAAVGEVRSAAGPVLFSTACKCHGVVQAFRLLGASK